MKCTLLCPAAPAVVHSHHSLSPFSPLLLYTTSTVTYSTYLSYVRSSTRCLNFLETGEYCTGFSHYQGGQDDSRDTHTVRTQRDTGRETQPHRDEQSSHQGRGPIEFTVLTVVVQRELRISGLAWRQQQANCPTYLWYQIRALYDKALPPNLSPTKGKVPLRKCQQIVYSTVATRGKVLGWYCSTREGFHDRLQY